MADKKASPDEAKKKKTADKVVTKKAIYFLPQHDVSVEADDEDDAVEQAKKLKESEEEGDG